MCSLQAIKQYTMSGGSPIMFLSTSSQFGNKTHSTRQQHAVDKSAFDTPFHDKNTTIIKRYFSILLY
jgi:hypothetical protein